MSELDQDFESLAAQINVKISEAAKALREANELAEKAGLDGLIFTQWIGDDMRQSNRYAEKPKTKEEIQDALDSLEQKYDLIHVRELESEMGSAGWSTSSSYC